MEASTGNKPRILVVGPEARARESLRVMLQPRYEVTTVESGKGAFGALSTFNPDLVFIDVRTPTPDGLEMLQQVKTHDSTIKVVVIGADASLEVLRKALTDGAYEYLIKPVFRSDLEETARRALARRTEERPSTEGVTRAEDRRRHPRVAVAWNVTLENDRGVEWAGEMMGLGPFGVKVRLETKESGLTEGAIVRLRFAPPDGKFPTPMSVKGMVWRVDPDGLVIVLFDLTAHAFLRIKGLVKALLK